MMSIIQLMPFPLNQVGGIETHVRGITSELQSFAPSDEKAKVSLAYRDTNGRWCLIDAEKIRDHIGRSVAEGNSDSLMSGIRSGNEFYDSIHSADVVHCHGLSRIGYLKLLRNINHKSKLVLSTHGSYWSELEHASGGISYPRNIFDKVMGRKTIGHFGAIVVASNAELQAMTELLRDRVGLGTVHVLPLPVFSNDEADPINNSSTSTGRVVALGRQDRIKNLELIVRTIINYPHLPPCDIIGPVGNSSVALARLVVGASPERIRIIEPVYGELEKMTILRNAAAVIVASKFESFSLVAHEAIRQDTPVVMSDNASRALSSTAVEIFESNNEASLAMALTRAIKFGRDEEHRIARARARAIQHSYQTYCQELRRIYRDAPSRYSVDET